MQLDSFGCPQCFQGQAPEAYALVAQTPILRFLEDDSHFIVSVRRCDACQQHFLWVFCETVDWEDGEDPQYRIIAPLLPLEAEQLLQTGWDLALANGLVAGRRKLCTDHPKGEEVQVYWSERDLAPLPPCE